MLVGVIAAPVACRGHDAGFDRRLVRFLVDHRRPEVAGPTRRLAELGSPAPVSTAVVTAAAIALANGVRPRTVGLQMGRAAAGVAGRRMIAEMIRRHRPPESWWWEDPSGFSYPSRHVTWAALGYGAATDLIAGSRRFGAVHVCAAGAIGAVASTRLVLAVHWPTDVLAAAAYAWGWRRLTALPHDANSHWKVG